MRTRRVSVLLAAVVVIMRLAGVTAAAPQAAGRSYADIIELYRRGEDELALSQLGMLTDTEIRHGSEALLGQIDFKRGVAMVRAAALLHTVRAFADRSRNNPAEFAYQFSFARLYIEQLVARDSRLERRASKFVETWRLFVLASYHGQKGVTAARDFARHAHDPAGDSAPFLLALGATEEMGWTLHQEEDHPDHADGDLTDAERDYRQALIISPELVEARVRLGRVLALRKDDEAVKVLEQIGESIEVPFQYLARLFEGDHYERAGKLAEAERQYQAAVALMPEPQSAFIALAHVRHAQGARGQAAQDIRVTTGARAVHDTADPWFWYPRGTAWRGPGYLDDLKAIIAP